MEYHLPGFVLKHKSMKRTRSVYIRHSHIWPTELTWYEPGHNMFGWRCRRLTYVAWAESDSLQEVGGGRSGSSVSHSATRVLIARVHEVDGRPPASSYIRHHNSVASKRLHALGVVKYSITIIFHHYPCLMTHPSNYTGPNIYCMVPHQVA